MIYFVFGLVSFVASIVGSICGIGGGVFMKPLLDAFHVVSVATISFLSGCTVLTMSIISVIKSRKKGKSQLDLKVSTLLAIGAATGGVLGKYMFKWVTQILQNDNMVGAVQALCLLLITIGTFIYTISAKRIRTKQIQNKIMIVVIGLLLGIMSSFLGIGGGPINLVVLYYFFSMETKTAAQNSIYIIMFSQITSLIQTLLTKSVPEFEIGFLILMVLGGFFGGLCGSKINDKIEAKTVDRLFLLLMLLIIAINIFNIIQFMVV